MNPHELHQPLGVTLTAAKELLQAAEIAGLVTHYGDHWTYVRTPKGMEWWRSRRKGLTL